MTTKALEKRAQVWEQMKHLMEDVGDREMAAEEVAKYEAMEAELRSIEKAAELETRHNERLGSFEAPVRILTPQTELETRDEYAESWTAWARTGIPGDLETRAQSVGTTTAGGFLAPVGFREDLVRTLKEFGSVRSVATVITTEGGTDLLYPAVNDTANKGAILAENTQATEQDVAFTQKTIKSWMYSSKVVRVARQLMQDSAFDIEEFLTSILGERIGRSQNEHFTIGVGTTEPVGIQPTATIGKTGAAGQVTTVLYADLVDLVHSVDVAYRRGTGVGFMTSDTMVGTIRKLLDSQNRPLWEPSIQVGEPDRILGYPVYVNVDMPVPAASVKSILFGDFRRGYIIRDVLGIETLRFDERWGDFLQVGFIGIARSDGQIRDAGAYKAYAHPAA
jgi:HK97 family phage major capsid protein